jgi:hypothetical protein
MSISLYSDPLLLLQSGDSLLAGDRVFVGNQPDDFALAGLFTENGEVALLGLGLGAAIRAIKASAPRARLTAVEIDPRTAECARALYERYFPTIDFEILVQDAWQFVRSTNRRYDVVCVDIFQPDGYVTDLTDPAFWEDVRSCLNGGGVALVNAWGLPHHLEPLRPPSPQRSVADAFLTVWPEARYLPSRRNLLLLSHSQPHRGLDDATLPSDLAGLDRAILTRLTGRLCLSSPLRGPCQNPTGPAPLTKSAINAEMAIRKVQMVATLERAAEHLGLALELRSDLSRELRRFVRTPSLAGPITEHLVAERHPVASFVPEAIAGLSYERVEGLSWYLEWIGERAAHLCRLDTAWFVNVAFWQALALSTNPLAPTAGGLPPARIDQLWPTGVREG